MSTSRLFTRRTVWGPAIQVWPSLGKLNLRRPVRLTSRKLDLASYSTPRSEPGPWRFYTTPRVSGTTTTASRTPGASTRWPTPGLCIHPRTRSWREGGSTGRWCLYTPTAHGGPTRCTPSGSRNRHQEDALQGYGFRLLDPSATLSSRPVSGATVGSGAFLACQAFLQRAS